MRAPKTRRVSTGYDSKSVVASFPTTLDPPSLSLLGDDMGSFQATLSGGRNVASLVQVLVSQSDNSFSIHDVSVAVLARTRAVIPSSLNVRQVQAIGDQGHASDVRALAISLDDQLVASVSAGLHAFQNLKSV